MKKIYLVVLLAALSFQSALAQTKTTIFGNLGVENVNISIVNTQYGTSTDAKGHYELPLFDRSETVNLYYSCIGYQDTVVSLTPKQLQHDSINVSFRMRKMSYDLQEVGVTDYSDFYRSGINRNIADMAFLDGKIYLLENRPKASSMVVLDTEGTEQARKDFDQLFERLHIDAFDDLILVGQDSCLQVYLDEKQGILPVSTFSREDYRNKIQKVVFEFSDAYLLRNTAYEKRDYFVKEFHGQAQTYNYVLKNDSLKQRHFLYRFIDTVAVNVCQSYLNEIFAFYNSLVPEKENELALGVWNGNLLRLAVNEKVHKRIGWYCQMLATEYHTTALKFNGFIQLIDLEKYEIVEVGKDFQITANRPLKVVSGERYFKNQFLTDEATGNNYGVFVNDGMYHVGLYDSKAGTVGMGQKASKRIYPRVFKVYGGYAYSVFFDSGSNRGVISRVKIG